MKSAASNSVKNMHTIQPDMIRRFHARSLAIQNSMCRFSYCRKLVKQGSLGSKLPSSYSFSDAAVQGRILKGKMTQ